MNDHELLRAYAVEGSQTAFARLVERHLPLVWSTACRQLHDDHLAQDVAQQVFTLLARKSLTLGSKIILSGWLYRTTSHLAARTLRGERRRFQREQFAVTGMNETHSDSAWLEIQPLLDEAMASLNELDRDAVVLRFFENKSLHEVGSALGSSEDAAQKRLARAIEKLRAFFGRRGKSITAGSLGAAMSMGAIQPAPAVLATTISAAALSGAVAANSTLTLTTLKIMSAATIKPILLAGAALAVSIVMVVQHNQAGNLRQQNEALQARMQKSEEISAELSERLQALALERDNDPRKLELLRLRGEASRLPGLEAELAQERKQVAQLESERQTQKAAQLAIEEAHQKFEARRSTLVRALKMVGLHMALLHLENNEKAAFAADGSLIPGFISENPNFDLKQIEPLVNDPAQYKKAMEEAPDTIVARTADPIPTPSGSWMRIYALADGSVQQITHEFPNQAFEGNWRLVEVKPRP